MESLGGDDTYYLLAATILPPLPLFDIQGGQRIVSKMHRAVYLSRNLFLYPLIVTPFSYLASALAHHISFAGPDETDFLARKII